MNTKAKKNEIENLNETISGLHLENEDFREEIEYLTEECMEHMSELVGLAAECVRWKRRQSDEQACKN